MRALITKGGAAQPSNAAEGLADEEKKSTVVSANTVDKNLPKHVNGKSQNLKNVTWGANTVQVLHTENNGSRLQDDVDMRAEDAGDVLEERKDTSPTKTVKMVQKRKEILKSCEKEYVPKVKAEEIKSEESTPQTKVTIQHDKKDIYKN